MRNLGYGLQWLTGRRKIITNLGGGKFENQIESSKLLFYKDLYKIDHFLTKFSCFKY